MMITTMVQSKNPPSPILTGVAIVAGGGEGSRWESQPQRGGSLAKLEICCLSRS